MNAWIEQIFQQWKMTGPLLIPLAGVCLGIWWTFFRTRRSLSDTLNAFREADGTVGTRGQTQGLTPCHPEQSRGSSISATGREDGMAGRLLGVLNAFCEGCLPGKTLEKEEEAVMIRLRRDFVLLAALTAMAPLLGLLGTVVGMIQTFDAVSAGTGETGLRISAGISRALMTTQFGLVVAIPGVFGLSHLQRLALQVRVQWAALKIRARYGL